jgi:hypothetical protein
VPYVVHAVGPNYNTCRDEAEGDELLRSAYASAMSVAAKAGIATIGFSLLSAGIFRGRRSLKVCAVRGTNGSVCDFRCTLLGSIKVPRSGQWHRRAGHFRADRYRSSKKNHLISTGTWSGSDWPRICISPYFNTN